MKILCRRSVEVLPFSWAKRRFRNNFGYLINKFQLSTRTTIRMAELHSSTAPLAEVLMILTQISNFCGILFKRPSNESHKHGCYQHKIIEKGQKIHLKLNGKYATKVINCSRSLDHVIGKHIPFWTGRVGAREPWKWFTKIMVQAKRMRFSWIDIAAVWWCSYHYEHL